MNGQYLNQVCCSAPGKVLVTGGYLVLDRQFDGLVFTINSRFYTIIKPIISGGNNNNNNNNDTTLCPIILSSPQFNSKQYYHLKYSKGQPIELGPDPVHARSFKENKYVEKTVIYTCIALSAMLTHSNFTNILSHGLDITIVGDNDFYSQIPHLKQKGLPISHESLKQLPKFLPLTFSLDDIQKTGLGSSAALVSSLTSSLLIYFNAIRLENSADREFLHNLAQLAHCVAQGKIGSGFDISSAIYGSQVYRRFSPSLIQNILNLYDKNQYPTSIQLLESILPSAKQTETNIKLNQYQQWDNQNQKCALPFGLQLILADVSVGSNTPVMVKKILEWRSTFPTQSKELWDKLYHYNSLVKESFNQLHQLHQQDATQYIQVIEKYAELSQDQWSSNDGPVAKNLLTIRESITTIRRLMREMGSAADVPLEPQEQTNLADFTMSVKGCVAAGVPGAGGFDALFAITLSQGSSDAIKQGWMGWKQCQVLPLVLNQDPIGVVQELVSPQIYPINKL